jgi:hypothetical protein
MNSIQWDHPILSKLSYSAAQYLIQNHKIIVLDPDFINAKIAYLDKYKSFYIVLEG